jgi:hypothetical protein
VTILTPEAIDYVIDKALSLIEQTPKIEPPDYLGEIQKLKKELTNFMALIASGQAPTSILVEITQREARIQSLEDEMKRLSETPDDWDPRQLRQQLQVGIGRFKDLMQGEGAAARKALRQLLKEPIRCIPAERDGKKVLRAEGQTTVGALLPQGYINMASPRGFEPLLPP